MMMMIGPNTVKVCLQDTGEVNNLFPVSVVWFFEGLLICIHIGGSSKSSESAQATGA